MKNQLIQAIQEKKTSIESLKNIQSLLEMETIPTVTDVLAYLLKDEEAGLVLGEFLNFLTQITNTKDYVEWAVEFFENPVNNLLDVEDLSAISKDLLPNSEDQFEAVSYHALRKINAMIPQIGEDKGVSTKVNSGQIHFEQGDASVVVAYDENSLEDVFALPTTIEVACKKLENEDAAVSTLVLSIRAIGYEIKKILE